MFWGTQASVTIAFFSDHWTPRLVALFVLPIVVMLTGFVASVVYGGHAIPRRTETERRQMVLISLLGVTVLGVGVAPHTAAMLLPLISAEDHSNRPDTLTSIGDPAPDFKLATVEGDPFHTVDLRGRVVVLNFFATWCGPCQKELPGLQAIWDEFRSNGDLRMLVVGREESEDVVKAFRQKHGFTFLMASDSDRSVYSTASYALIQGTLGPDAQVHLAKFENDGMFLYVVARKSSHITDGLSNTAMVGEVVLSDTWESSNTWSYALVNAGHSTRANRRSWVEHYCRRQHSATRWVLAAGGGT